MFCFEMLRRVTHCGVFLHFGGDLKLLQHMLVPAEKPAPQEASRHVATWTWQIVPSINPFPKSCQVFFRRFRQVWSIRGGDWLFKGFERSPASSLDSFSMQGLPWRRKSLMSRGVDVAKEEFLRKEKSRFTVLFGPWISATWFFKWCCFHLHVGNFVNVRVSIGDVLVAVGAISANVGGTSLGLGGECYGTITAVGQAKPVTNRNEKFDLSVWAHLALLHSQVKGWPMWPLAMSSLLHLQTAWVGVQRSEIP